MSDVPSFDRFDRPDTPRVTLPIGDGIGVSYRQQPPPVADLGADPYGPALGVSGGSSECTVSGERTVRPAPRLLNPGGCACLVESEGRIRECAAHYAQRLRRDRAARQETAR